jgi:predicted O-methyltransferase YrrM
MGRMYTSFQFASHLVMSRRWNAFHSPYLFKLFTLCCDDQQTDPAFRVIESKRREWIHSKETITRKDFGAGSSFQQKQDEERISRIAKRSLSLPFQCRFMSRLAAFMQPRQIVELGTSLGISAAYLSIGAPNAQMDTVEGDPEVAGIAKKMFESLQLRNIKVYNCTFDEYASQHHPSLEKIDLLFLDGDHRLEATIANYQALKAHFHTGTIVVIDDIYWSRDMTDCWKLLMASPEVTQSVDCFHFGLLFFNLDFRNKENHIVRLPLRMQLK